MGEKGLNRLRAASRNAVTTMVTQLIGLVLKFGVQTAFIRSLSEDYLGLNGLFTNLVSFLSFADLGIGTAITVGLYQPIARGQVTVVQALMAFYQRLYRVIILVMAGTGLAIAPLLPLLIKDTSFKPGQLALWFLGYLLMTLATYFSAHQRSLLMAMQQDYLTVRNDFGFKVIQQVAQIIILVQWQSFLGFLVIQLVMAICSNWRLSRMARKRHPEIFLLVADQEHPKLAAARRHEIRQTIVGAIANKIGAVVIFSTDNLVLAMWVGLTAVAKYANYLLIVQSISAIFAQVMGSVVSSIGHLHATATPQHQQRIFYRLLYLNTGVNLMVSVGLSFAMSRFIVIWAGPEYRLATLVTMLIVLNYSLSQSRYVVTSFISGLGCFWALRWKAIVEAGVNIGLSLLLVGQYGILGVVLGTLVSHVLINLVWEPALLFRVGTLGPLRQYLVAYLKYEGLIVVVIGVMSWLSTKVGTVTIAQLAGLTLGLEVVIGGLFVAMTCRSPAFQYFKGLLIKAVKRVFQAA
ncbi:lipopolysaccharide biosynthesis protein [Lactiplantibacillus pingfangensis]|uniref:lipopolysaccharide biosynthesis protein n=1 Tax=Lactiplantibacillus pingfangensis TaxID=2559915 RepID=UPI0010F8B37D|nr:hypothetical protein [Lactiplantibacillus pingfangensis]